MLNCISAHEKNIIFNQKIVTVAATLLFVYLWTHVSAVMVSVQNALTGWIFTVPFTTFYWYCI